MRYKRFILAALVLSFLVFGSGCFKDGENENPQPERSKYVLTLNLNGGALPDGNVIEFYGGERVDLPLPQREGYTFGGWYADEGCKGARFNYIDEKYAICDIELWAKWIKDENKTETEENKYKITYVLNGGRFADGSTEEDYYIAGIVKILPVPQFDGYKFLGWYEDSGFSGSPVYEIEENSAGDKTFYASWEKLPDVPEQPDNPDNPDIPDNPDNPVTPDNPDVPDNPNESEGQGDDKPKPEVYLITFNLNGGKFLNETYVPESYRSGQRITLPLPERENYIFGGWFANGDFSGKEIKEISASDRGNKSFYAMWTEIQKEHLIKIKNYGGFKERAFVEVEPTNDINAEDFTVEYREMGISSVWEKVDEELINNTGGVIRANILGLKAGNYEIKVKCREDIITLSDVTVVAYDRTGEVFKNSKSSCLGGYNLDGTVKKGAIIVYVTDKNKNDVQANIGGKTCKGICEILSEFGNTDEPLILRFIGEVSAATWNYLEYNSQNVYNGKKLYEAINQYDLLSRGFNSLDTQNHTVLDGLVNKIIFKDGQFDSYWNMCETAGASNITVEGVGSDAVISQWGFSFTYCKSIEVRNLTFRDYPENACRFADCADSESNIWVHDNNFEKGKNNWNVSPDAGKAFGDGDLVFLNVASKTEADNKFARTR